MSSFFELCRNLPDAEATAELGRELSLFVAAGDCICLDGDLGTGKTSLARALIRALEPHGTEIEVPSPTFTLVQLYGELRVPVAHCDLYRLSDPREVDELGLEDIAGSHVTLIEWPDRLNGDLPADRIDVSLRHDGDGRSAVLTAHGRMARKLARIAAVAAFLEANGLAGAARRFFQGDASSRRYEMLTTPAGKTLLLMDMPDSPDGPPVRDGRPYSDIAHLATGIRAVVAVNGQLSASGFSAPVVLASDMAQGLATIEHLDGAVYGDMMRAGEDVSEPLHTAVAALAEMAKCTWPQTVGLPGDEIYRLARFDIGAFMIEAELLLDWFWPAATGSSIDDNIRQQFCDAWRALYAELDRSDEVWMLRDFHSPNLIWLPQRAGVARVGLIDTQDAVIGPTAYDLVSLLQDARIDIAAGTEAELLDVYCACRMAAVQDTGVAFDSTVFKTSYAILGAQRATKILGIFVRLANRDGKPHYLKHVPRVSRYLERNLAHPALAQLRSWYDRFLPAERRATFTGDLS